ncbi:hypothetical protein O3P69_007495 [Scylla paramamosain]|uniref:Uncharacterized protein n=1 Tax=Scylla paramamosain TaxID=85552 RepID=A0AAW0V517_SCYPA
MLQLWLRPFGNIILMDVIISGVSEQECLVTKEVICSQTSCILLTSALDTMKALQPTFSDALSTVSLGGLIKMSAQASRKVVGTR